VLLPRLSGSSAGSAASTTRTVCRPSAAVQVPSVTGSVVAPGAMTPLAEPVRVRTAAPEASSTVSVMPWEPPPEAMVPSFLMATVKGTASPRAGLAGVQPTSATRSAVSGTGTASPNTWNSATCPPGAPEFAVIRSRTSAARASTGMVTVLPVAGSKVYVAWALIVVNAEPPSWRPSTSMVWVRRAQIGSGSSLSTTEVRSASPPRETVSVSGYAWPSQYVRTSPSLAFCATYVWVCEEALIGLPRARSMPGSGPGSSSSGSPWTSSSDSWAAGQPVLAVMWSRTYRAVPLSVTVADGAKW